MKKLQTIRKNRPSHWVGDGFYVQSLIAPDADAATASPFLLLDYAAPYEFAPRKQPYGVGAHPHRGFETVTIVFAGEVEHADSAGHSGRIAAGDVQWMTAGSGLVHQEYYTPGFSAQGGTAEMVQIWVNLPQKDKMHPPRYQTLMAADIAQYSFPHDAGYLRVIAGEYAGAHGIAKTFSPINMWDVRIAAEQAIELEVPEGHHAIVLVRRGQVLLQNEHELAAKELALFQANGHLLRITTNALAAECVVLTGLPLNEPVVWYGPFVMNTREEIHQAIQDYQAGKMG